MHTANNKMGPKLFIFSLTSVDGCFCYQYQVLFCPSIIYLFMTGMIISRLMCNMI